MTEMADILVTQPRSLGSAEVSVRRLGEQTVIEGLRQSGSMRVLFPRCDEPAMQAVLVNTAGGLTGGDRFNLSVSVNEGASLTLTTQAAERAYRAQPGQTARVQNNAEVKDGAHLNWLPQELILFEGSALKRRLVVELATKASCLLVEPLVFGRMAMGEVISNGSFSDHIEIMRDGVPIYLDKIRISGDLAAHLARPAIANGATAMASLIMAGDSSEAFLEPLRKLLPETAGASLVHQDLLVARVLAFDSHELRKTLVPAVKLLGKAALPRPWMI